MSKAVKGSLLLVINTGVTYARSVLAVGLALFSSRWIFGALGEVDFGLFSLVGSILLFVAYLNSVLAGSSSRHFAYSIGQGDTQEVNNWFNAALGLHLCLACFLTICGWLVGDYVIEQVFNIPQERVLSCQYVFRVSLVSLFISMVSIPFVAMFKAKQQITEVSLWNMLQTVLQFLLAWYMLQASGDRLVIYAIGMTSILSMIYTGQIVRAVIVFEECQISLARWFAPHLSKKLLSFATWNFIGFSGLIFRNEGSAILLNLYFGPSINAAYGIAKRVVTQADQLAGAMIGAFAPEITAREGRGERESMVRLSLQTSKFGTLLILLFLVPLMVEMEYVLRLWLVNPPDYVATFCRLVLIAYLLDRLSTGFMLAISAQGRIAAYQSTVGLTLLLTLPLAWFFLTLGLPPTSVGVAFVITMALCSFGRVLWAKKLLQISINSWLKAVVVPCSTVAITSSTVACLTMFLCPDGFFRLFIVTVSSTIVYSVVVWWWALDARERKFIGKNIHRLKERL